MCFRPGAANLNQPIRCPVCGKINRPDATKCIKCGATEAEMAAALETPPATSAAATSNAPTAPKKPGAPGAPTAPGA